MVADIRERIRHGRVACKPCQANAKKRKGKLGKEKRVGEEVSSARGRVEVPFDSAPLCQVVVVEVETRRRSFAGAASGSYDH